MQISELQGFNCLYSAIPMSSRGRYDERLELCGEVTEDWGTSAQRYLRFMNYPDLSRYESCARRGFTVVIALSTLARLRSGEPD